MKSAFTKPLPTSFLVVNKAHWAIFKQTAHELPPSHVLECSRYRSQTYDTVRWVLGACHVRMVRTRVLRLSRLLLMRYFILHQTPSIFVTSVDLWWIYLVMATTVDDQPLAVHRPLSTSINLYQPIMISAWQVSSLQLVSALL